VALRGRLGYAGRLGVVGVISFFCRRYDIFPILLMFWGGYFRFWILEVKLEFSKLTFER